MLVRILPQVPAWVEATRITQILAPDWLRPVQHRIEVCTGKAFEDPGSNPGRLSNREPVAQRQSVNAFTSDLLHHRVDGWNMLVSI